MVLGLELPDVTGAVEVVDSKLVLEEQYWLLDEQYGLEEQYPKIDLGWNFLKSPLEAEFGKVILMFRECYIHGNKKTFL